MSSQLLKEYTNVRQYSIFVKDTLREDLENNGFIPIYGNGANKYELCKKKINKEAPTQLRDIEYSVNCVLTEDEHDKIKVDFDKYRDYHLITISGETYDEIYWNFHSIMKDIDDSQKILEIINLYFRKYFEGTENRLRSVAIMTPNSGVIFTQERDYHKDGEIMMKIIIE